MKNVLILCTLLGAVPALAGTPRQGEREVAVQLSYSNFSNGSAGSSNTETTLITGNFGYLLTDHHELGFSLGYESQKVVTTASDSRLGANYTYNFKGGQDATPFLGLHAGVLNYSNAFGDSPYKSFYGVEAGVKLYPWDHAGFLFSASWDQYNKDAAPKNGQLLAMKIGITLKF